MRSRPTWLPRATSMAATRTLPLKGWFESLHSRKGPCCSDADGTALSDVDWEAKDGHYRVRIEGQWWDSRRRP
jgi:hypothetical protein